MRAVGLPKFGLGYANTVLEHSLTSADDVPNASGAAIGADVTFDAVKGCKSLNLGAYTDGRIFYDGPYSANPAAAWTKRDAEFSANHGITIAFEVERAVFDGGVDAIAGTGGVSPLQFRAGTNSGFFVFGRSGTAGNATYETTLSTTHPGITSQSAYCSRYANDKDFVPIVISLRRSLMDVYVDGYRAQSMAATVNANSFDDMYLIGRQYVSNSTPVGFPFWMRNFMVLDTPVALAVNPTYNNLTVAGDSVAAQGDYYIGAPSYNSAHPGSNADAGMCPLIERLLSRTGIYTSIIKNSARTGTRTYFNGTATGLIDQIDGTNAGTVYDAKNTGGKILIIHCGLNDVLSETTSTANIKSAMKTVLETALEGRYEQVYLCNVYDAQGAQGVSNSASVIAARTIDINSAYKELANGMQNVFLVDINAAMGSQNAAYFRSDLIHPTEQGQAIITREIFSEMMNHRT